MGLECNYPQLNCVLSFTVEVKLRPDKKAENHAELISGWVGGVKTSPRGVYFGWFGRED